MRIYLLSFALLSIIFLSSCEKTDHEIRFQNQYSKNFGNVVIGPNNYGTVNSGATSAYKGVPEGSGSFSGLSTDSTHIPMSGSYSVSGKGKHKWTITLSSAGTFSFKEDK